MPINLSLATALEKNKLSSDVPLIALIDVEIVDPATGVVSIVEHFANNPESVTYNGVVYKACGFDFEVNQESGKPATVSISITDYTQEVQARMQQYGGMMGSNVTLYIVAGDNLAAPPEIVEYFQVTGSSAANYVCTFNLGAEQSMLMTFPRRRQQADFCQWRYKSAECGYTGGMATCDLTLSGPNGCGAHGNAINFGGFPGLSSDGNRYY